MYTSLFAKTTELFNSTNPSMKFAINCDQDKLG